MRRDLLDGLLELPTLRDRALRRAAFRQSIASLALEASVDAPSPLEGLNPKMLAESVRAALDDGLLDHLDWLAAPAAAVSLYELAAALPPGRERRDVGRRAAVHLQDGSAATFVAIATRMAAGPVRALSGAGVRARVALALSLPSTALVRADPLALALASRRELAREWVGALSIGSLPERRLAARLLERAARESFRRASQGDGRALRIFGGVARAARGGGAPPAGAETITAAWQALLADRETLVWRHVAAARGILSGVMPELHDEIAAHVHPDLSPTEWRRGATSLVARIAVAPEQALRDALTLIDTPMFTADPGLGSAMVWGLARAADAEPEASEQLLSAIAAASPIAIAESLVELRDDVGLLSPEAYRTCTNALATSLVAPDADEDLAALARAILRDLSPEDPPSELRAAIQNALEAFAELGTREAHARAVEALAVAEGTVVALEALEVDDDPSPQAKRRRRTSLGLLRELDIGLLESDVLKSLLLLDRRVSDDAAGVAPLDDIDERLASWLVVSLEGASSRAHVTLRQRQLRTLLHVVDGDTIDLAEDQTRATRARARWIRVAHAMHERVARGPRSPLRRAELATLARALDGLVRGEAADPADVLLHAAMRLRDPNDLGVLAEASMNPDASQLLAAYAAFTRSAAAARESAADCARALRNFLSEMPTGGSQRTEMLVAMLARVGRELDAIRSATGLRALLPEGGAVETSPLVSLEDALIRFAQLVDGARRRVGDAVDDDAPPSRTPWLGTVVATGFGANAAQSTPQLRRAVDAFDAWLCERVPAPLAAVVAAVLTRAANLPLEPGPPSLRVVAQEQPLPAWIPSRRTLGGFYVVRQLGGGALGSVFVVTRADERHEPNAERFALKVPEYSATAARSVSEGEFLRLFRQEAGALLAIPEHPNLARFVTFDAGARPKPILVMELVEGARCDQLIASRSLVMPSALRLLDGVLAGLDAMHSVGVGHLDVKPSNVILRENGDPVLVDFGLAGRHIRPGCATGCYGAPEIWGILPDGVIATPMAADVYAFGCVAYEVLTTKTLFDAPTDVALIAAHLTHDGSPPGIAELTQDRRCEPVADLLRACLRRNPNERATVARARALLHRAAASVSAGAWPLGAG